MIIYIEKQALEYPKTKKILNKFPDAKRVYIEHYKNIFDKKISYPLQEKIWILAVQQPVNILKVPDQYGVGGIQYFFKPVINCVYNCTYCYLQATFKNSFIVVFVNEEEIQGEIKKQHSVQPGYRYATNYSDVLALDAVIGFTETYLPFFATLEGSFLEMRTKSVNIEYLLNIEPISNIEIAFSLNPQSVIEQYEQGSTSLAQRVQAIKQLQNHGWKIGLRFLPLLQVEDYEDLYGQMFEYVGKNLDQGKINSLALGSLIYTPDDYKRMVQKRPDFVLLQKLEQQELGRYSAPLEAKEKWEVLCTKHFPSLPMYRDMY